MSFVTEQAGPAGQGGSGFPEAVVAPKERISGVPPAVSTQSVGARTLARVLVDRWFVQQPVPASLHRLQGRLGLAQALILRRARAIFTRPRLQLLRAGNIQTKITISAIANSLAEYGSLTRRPEQPGCVQLAFGGGLTPRSGAVEFLGCVAGWARSHPNLNLQIVWFGDGDMAGVLHAQLVPPNVTQRFLGSPTQAERRSVLAESGLFVAGNLNESEVLALEAMAAAVPVLASLRDSEIRNLILEGRTGWLVDPCKPGAMVNALETALSMPAEARQRFGFAGRGRLLTLCTMKVSDGGARMTQDTRGALLWRGAGLKA